MELTRGNLTPHRLFSIQELRLSNPEPRVDLLIGEFLRIGEAIAAQWIQFPKAVLLLQMAPEDPASGAIYVYDRQQQVFYLLAFDGPDDNLTVESFRELMLEYKLLGYAEEPSLLRVTCHLTASA